MTGFTIITNIFVYSCQQNRPVVHSITSYASKLLFYNTYYTVITLFMSDTPLHFKKMGAFLSVDRYVVLQGIQIDDMFFFALKTQVLVTDVTRSRSLHYSES